MSTYTLLAPIWNVGSKIGGLNRALENYIARIDIPLPKNPKIIDAGCGTGIISFALLDKFPDANIVATDLNTTMLKTCQSIAFQKNISFNKIVLGKSNINSPEKVTLFGDRFNDKQIELESESFDLIVASAVLEHANLDVALKGLIKLLRPGGYLLIISMKNNFFGKIYGYIYQFKPISNLLPSLLKNHNCKITLIPFNKDEFPINLRRTGLLVEKYNIN